MITIVRRAKDLNLTETMNTIWAVFHEGKIVLLKEIEM